MARAAILSLILALAAMAGRAPAAHDYEIGPLVVQHPWARASIGLAKAGAAYLTIVNQGAAADRLRAIETPAAKRAGLHTSTLENGIMKMRPVEAIEIAPGEPAVLAPGGLHIMLMGLEAPLESGALFPMTLIFEDAGRVEVQVYVAGPMEMEGAEPNHTEHGPGN